MSVEQWSDLLFSEAGPRDGHAYGSVRAVNEDGSYMVQLNASNTLTRCAPFCTAMVGDRVKVVINANGKCDAIGRLGGEIGGGGEPAVYSQGDVSDWIAGRVFAYAGTDEPIGSLLCDGRAVSRREYWELFDAIGTTYGAGDGSSTFNLPNIESRTIIGESDSYALGAVGGEETVSLTEAQNGPHVHGTYGLGIHKSYLSTDANNGFAAMRSVGRSNQYNSYEVTDSRGEGAPHNNMQPYIVMRYFITTGKGDPVSGINPADYVVEWGTTDEWTWRKYASGIAECWLSKAFSTATGFSAWGSGYLSNEKLAPREYPFEFVDYPMVTADYRTVGSDWSMSAVMSQGSKTESPTVQGFRPSPMSSGTTYTFQVSVHAIGPIKKPSASGGTETIAPTIAERFEGIESDVDSLAYDSGWQNLYVTTNLDVKARKVGKIVYLYGHSSNGYPVDPGAYVAITTLPVGWRPTFDIPISLDSHGGDNAEITGYIGTNGILYLYSGSDRMTHWRCFTSFPVD